MNDKSAMTTKRSGKRSAIWSGRCWIGILPPAILCPWKKITEAYSVEYGIFKGKLPFGRNKGTRGSLFSYLL